MVLTPGGRIVEFRNIDMFDNNNNLRRKAIILISYGISITRYGREDYTSFNKTFLDIRVSHPNCLSNKIYLE